VTVSGSPLSKVDRCGEVSSVPKSGVTDSVIPLVAAPAAVTAESTLSIAPADSCGRYKITARGISPPFQRLDRGPESVLSTGLLVNQKKLAFCSYVGVVTCCGIEHTGALTDPTRERVQCEHWVAIEGP